VPGVFARDLVYFLEDAQGAQGNVLQIADGRSDEIEQPAWLAGSSGGGFAFMRKSLARVPSGFWAHAILLSFGTPCRRSLSAPVRIQMPEVWPEHGED